MTRRGIGFSAREWTTLDQARHRAISRSRWFAGTSYCSIALAIALCSSVVSIDADELGRRPANVADGPGVRLLFGLGIG